MARVKGKKAETPRPSLPPEVPEEAKALLRLWEQRPVGEDGEQISQMNFGLKYDLGSQGNIGHYLHGRQALNLRAAIAFSKELHRPIADFSRRLATQLRALELSDPVLDVVEGIGKLPDADQHQVLDFISYRFERAHESLFASGKTLQHYLQMIQRLKRTPKK